MSLIKKERSSLWKTSFVMVTEAFLDFFSLSGCSQLSQALLTWSFWNWNLFIMRTWNIEQSYCMPYLFSVLIWDDVNILVWLSARYCNITVWWRLGWDEVQRGGHYINLKILKRHGCGHMTSFLPISLYICYKSVSLFHDCYFFEVLWWLISLVLTCTLYIPCFKVFLETFL